MKYIDYKDLKFDTWYLVQHYDGCEMMAYHTTDYKWITVYPYSAIENRYIELMDEGDIRYVFREAVEGDILPFVPPVLKTV